ncbi:hypothetical protein [Microbacterium sp.]|uniref:hypothetical protein n=1 Tax=Microbacterium sp. TaxID=51671 RepID=UPI003734EDC1
MTVADLQEQEKAVPDFGGRRAVWQIESEAQSDGVTLQGSLSCRVDRDLRWAFHLNGQSPVDRRRRVHSLVRGVRVAVDIRSRGAAGNARQRDQRDYQRSGPHSALRVFARANTVAWLIGRAWSPWADPV